VFVGSVSSAGPSELLQAESSNDAMNKAMYRFMVIRMIRYRISGSILEDQSMQRWYGEHGIAVTMSLLPKSRSHFTGLSRH